MRDVRSLVFCSKFVGHGEADVVRGLLSCEFARVETLLEPNSPVVINLVSVLIPDLVALTELPMHAMSCLVIDIHVVATAKNHRLSL